MPPKTVFPIEFFAGIERSGPVPLWDQVASRMESAIVDGSVPAGTRIDTELDLAERLQLSRPTIRRAIQELVDKGLVVRRRGIGTEVVRAAVTRRVALTSLFDDLAESGRAPVTRVLEFEVRPAEAEIAGRLGVAVDAPVLHLRRLRATGETPLAVLDNTLPEPYTDLDREELAEAGLYDLLRRRGVELRIAQQRIGARPATPEESRLLEIPRHDAVLTMQRVAFDAAGRAVESGSHAYRHDLYSFELTLVDR